MTNYIPTFESFLNESSEIKYKKGDRVKYQIHLSGSPMVSTGKAEILKNVSIGKIVKSTKKFGQPIYILDNGMEISRYEILGLV